jgi:hypothetical protein
VGRALALGGGLEVIVALEVVQGLQFLATGLSCQCGGGFVLGYLPPVPAQRNRTGVSWNERLKHPNVR